jgi:hypothetical protein
VGRAESTTTSSASEDPSTPSSITSPTEASTCRHEEEVAIVPRKPAIEYGIRERHPDIDIDDRGSLFQTSPHKVARIRNLIRQAYQDAMLRTPRPESLQMLIRINVTIAFARNAERMGFPIEGLCYDHYVSPFNNQGPGMDERWDALPESLRPTALQKSVIHHPWIDLFPFPRMRDNALRAIEAGFDDDLLCFDVMEIYHADGEDRPTLMVWGESWDGMGWEVSAPFLKKWGWLLEGCPEMLQSTNKWRETRGEKSFT